MDPIELPVEVSEMIFLHLKGTELLEASFVSRDWYNFIGSSSVCMKKLTLALRGDWRDFTEDKKLLMNGREYQNALISYGSEVLNFIYDVVKSRKKMKTLRICNTRFPTTSDFFELLENFEQIEHIDLTAVKIEIHEELPIDNKFKQLKSLKIFLCEDKVGASILKNCSEVETLIWEVSVGSCESSNSIVDSLKCQLNLKKLSVCPKVFNCIPAVKIKELPFKLQDISVIQFSYFGGNYSIEDQLLQLLQIQSNNIKRLCMGDWFGLNVMKFALSMKNLKEVKLSYIPTLGWNEIDLPSSASISFMDIVTTCTRNEIKIKAILMAVPNVKKLRLRSIDENLASFISQNLKQLRKICLVHPPRNRVKRILPAIVFDF